uniref:acetyl-CoA carboxylase carboxyltransferase alphasubunit n=1 Tax=Galdieria phlegrea TaxID=1389228 RepID=UPI0023D8928F|nr:acetyl-CoA carboxylase carboxyltransferase alphasubunit [Galdieria phlegrea]WDA99848.1 acetyl-CoA carboxylase carboxyltransferase alphasubunit [Galdieria phlegrea]|eukprot:jgi/Galph1/4558/GphlegSOOS_G3210.1
MNQQILFNSINNILKVLPVNNYDLRKYINFEKPILDIEKDIRRILYCTAKNSFKYYKLQNQILNLKNRLEKIREIKYKNLKPIDKLNLVRQQGRPSGLDVIKLITEEWIELFGDRKGFNDRGLVGGLGRIGGKSVILIAHERGKTPISKMKRHFGMAYPGGYRKALRLMQHANQFNLPILTFIDTAGAWAGLDAEHFGQSEAIAVNLREMFNLNVPIISTVIGEGGSGGALAVSIADYIIMLEYSIYSVASPEACSAILWKDRSRYIEASECLKITAQDLKIIGIIDEIIEEPIGGYQINPIFTIKNLKDILIKKIKELENLSNNDRKDNRYKKFRQIGIFYE